MANQTLIKVKPDAYEAGNVGNIIALFEKAGFRVKALKVVQLNQEMAEQFYAIHNQRPFFNDLVTFMTSGPVVPMVMEIDNGDAVALGRKVIGATDPAEAADGTVRKLYATSKEKNAVHGSDSDENAANEISFYFKQDEII